MKTEGERVFSRYLEAHQLRYEYEKPWPHTGRRPDFTIWDGDRLIVADVKDIEPIPFEEIRENSTFDPYQPIRSKIHDSRVQFSPFKSFPCCLVLFNAGHLRAFLHEPTVMFGAMEGNLGFSIAINRDTGETVESSFQNRFLDGGKMARPKKPSAQNTTYSALVTVRALDVKSLIVSQVLIVL